MYEHLANTTDDRHRAALLRAWDNARHALRYERCVALWEPSELLVDPLPTYNCSGLFFRIGPAGRPTRARYVPRQEIAHLRHAFVGITLGNRTAPFKP